MLKHDQIWSAIDALAARHGLSASGLARRAGLDPTTFNRSKRLTPSGRQRWPSTESVAKILMATNETLDTFVSLIAEPGAGGALRLPLIGSAAAARAESFSPGGAPTGPGWDELAPQGLAHPQAFAIEIEAGAATTLYKEGAVIIAAAEAPVRRGDRIVARRRDGRLAIGEVRRETATAIDLAEADAAGGAVTLARGEIDWIARIFWVSQ